MKRIFVSAFYLLFYSFRMLSIVFRSLFRFSDVKSSRNMKIENYLAQINLDFVIMHKLNIHHQVSQSIHTHLQVLMRQKQVEIYHV